MQEPNQYVDVLRKALRTPSPALVKTLVDPDDPPLLPEIKSEHAMHMATALARGTTNAADIAKKLARNTIDEIT